MPKPKDDEIVFWPSVEPQPDEVLYRGPRIPEHKGRYPEEITSWKVDFRGRPVKATRWTNYRIPKLVQLGFTDYEIMSLAYNRLSNPRIQQLIGLMQVEVRALQQKFGLATYTEAAAYRRKHFVELIETGDITEDDPYTRMGYDDN